MRPRNFEKALLEFASRSDIEINPATIAHHFNISMAESRLQLDRLVKLGVLEVQSADTGRLYYVLPGREEMSPRPELPWDPRRAVVAAALIWGALAAGALGVALFANEPVTPHQGARPAPMALTAAPKAPGSRPAEPQRLSAAPFQEQRGYRNCLRRVAAQPTAQAERHDLTLITYPFGAAVYEGEKFLGLTPLILGLSDEAPHSYRLVKPGYQSRTVRAAGSGHHTYELELTPGGTTVRTGSGGLLPGVVLDR
jgi:hypothetical protein